MAQITSSNIANNDKNSLSKIFPNELILEIIKHLPLIDLMKSWRCVSQNWLKILCSYDFAQFHSPYNENSDVFPEKHIMTLSRIPGSLYYNRPLKIDDRVE